MSRSSEHRARYLAVALFFCCLCLFYLGKLLVMQIKGPGAEEEKTVTKLVTIQAVRGEIYDRNGNALIKNEYAYDLKLSFADIDLLNRKEVNKTYLALLGALDDCNEQSTHTEKFFPFEGAYPFYEYSAEALDGDSVTYYRLQRVLKDLSLPSDTSASKLAEHYIKTNALLAKESGKRLYPDPDVDRLIRFYYDLDARRFESTGEYLFAENISRMLLTYVKELGLPGVSVFYNMNRVYCYPGYASHILGTVGPIYSEEWEYYNEQGYPMNATVGKSGCELAFESYLHGVDGVMAIVSDLSGNVLSSEIRTPPVAGSDVYLTLDIHLQIAAEDGLANNTEYVVSRSGGLASHGAECNAGAAVAMDPQTFEVLAIASYPTFDLSTYNADFGDLAANEALPLLNRALNGTYAPGSTFKLGMAVTGMMEGVITPTSTVTCTGEYPRTYSEKGVGCSTYTTSGYEHSSINVVRALAVSCNSFFCELGSRLGIETMENYMSKFGIGQPTGLELGGKTGSLAGPSYRQSIRSAEEWDSDLTLIASIGQSDNQASPLQLACYMATLANGGTRYSAHLLNCVYPFGSATPETVYTQTEDTVLDRTEIPTEYLFAMFRGMKEVVEGNTTVRNAMRNIPVTVGGKTGTAQNSTDCDNALFVCAAPYDQPEIVVSVVLEKGYSGGYASLTAASILEEYYKSN